MNEAGPYEKTERWSDVEPTARSGCAARSAARDVIGAPRHRALLYVTFARPWYVDAGFPPQMKPRLVPGAAAATTQF